MHPFQQSSPPSARNANTCSRAPPGHRPHAGLLLFLISVPLRPRHLSSLAVLRWQNREDVHSKDETAQMEVRSAQDSIRHSVSCIRFSPNLRECIPVLLLFHHHRLVPQSAFSHSLWLTLMLGSLLT
jgi:hypothetical protein